MKRKVWFERAMRARDYLKFTVKNRAKFVKHVKFRTLCGKSRKK